MRESQRIFRNHRKEQIRFEDERRTTYRYPAKMKEAEVGWGEGESRTVFPATLENVSMSGCLLKCSCKPSLEPGGPIYFKSSYADNGVWIAGELVSAVKPFLRKCLVRMCFVSPLPFPLFKLLVYGPEGIDLQSLERPDYESDQFWR